MSKKANIESLDESSDDEFVSFLPKNNEITSINVSTNDTNDDSSISSENRNLAENDESDDDSDFEHLLQIASHFLEKKTDATILPSKLKNQVENSVKKTPVKSNNPNDDSKSTNHEKSNRPLKKTEPAKGRAKKRSMVVASAVNTGDHHQASSIPAKKLRGRKPKN